MSGSYLITGENYGARRGKSGEVSSFSFRGCRLRKMEVSQMIRFMTLLLIVSLAAPIVAQEQPIVQQALNAAANAGTNHSTQMSSGGGSALDSIGGWGGLALLSAGIALAALSVTALQDDNNTSTVTTDDKMNKPLFYAGIGALGGWGALVAFSPSVTDRGIAITHTLGF